MRGDPSRQLTEAELHAETAPLLQPSLVLLARKWRRPATIAPVVSTRARCNELCSCGSGKKYKRCCG
ncbi:MAG: hypothetical protein FD129_1479 [bacterium]|nr:MAG: hypothetical protein FD129_1479 [bacterium]